MENNPTAVYFASQPESTATASFQNWQASNDSLPLSDEDNCNTFFNMIVRLEGSTKRSEFIDGKETYSMYGITPEFINTYIKDEKALADYQTKLSNGKLTKDDAEDIYCALWNVLDISSKPADV